MNIYTPDGWLDIAHIEEVAIRNLINFIIIIGKRQVGKTYGVLKHMLDNDRRIILTRRVTAELQMLTNNVNSPFEKIYPGEVQFKRGGKYTSDIVRTTLRDGEEVTTPIGMACALTTIGNVRGFNGDIYTDWIFDEFIPEEHLYKVRNEGDAFLNAHTTLNGNRELEGRPPIRSWLLANSNNLNSGILSALNIDIEVERMSLTGEEVRLLTDRGIMIILPDSTKIIEARKQGALYRAIGNRDSNFKKMAYENEFSYNDRSDVRSCSLRDYNPLITVGGITISLHKNEKLLYVSDRLRATPRHTYTDADSQIRQLKTDYPELRPAFLKNRMIFQNMHVKNIFLNMKLIE